MVLTFRQQRASLLVLDFVNGGSVLLVSWRLNPGQYRLQGISSLITLGWA
jgi:hypothetical protein